VDAVGKEDVVNKESDMRKTNWFFKNKGEKVQLKRKLKELASGTRELFRAIFWIFAIVFLIFYVIFAPLPKESE
jgi:hypothetical protein